MPIPGASPVYAIDAAGNLSLESAAFSFDGLCPPISPAERDRGGCSVTRARAPSRNLLGALLCMALLAAVRRHARARTA